MPCDQNIPACAGLFAACTLNSTTYAQIMLPDASPFRFLAAALPNEDIELTFFFVTEEDVGLNTEIDWNEPGCSDMQSYESHGDDLFNEAKDTNTITRKKAVFEGGDHLIEVFTDMRAVVDITVDVTEPQDGSP